MIVKRPSLDFLDEFIAARAAKNPAFVKLVEKALKARLSKGSRK